MNNLQENLLGGKGKKQSKEYKRKFEECENKVKMLRNKNNELQRQNDNQLDCDIRLAIKQQMTFIKKEIQSIKEMIEKLSKQYNDPASKNKIKQLWNMAAKEIQRNKRLMEDFVNRASSSRSFLNRQSQKANRKTKTQFQHQNVQKHKNKNKQNQEIKQSSILQSQDLITEINFQRKIQAQKNALLKQLQQKNYKINEIMNEMGRMVGEQQKDVIDVIQANNMTTKQNIEQSNDLLGNAIENQKKSQKKFICIVITIIIALLIAGGITYIIVSKN